MNTTAKTLSALLLGAALVTPALAQDAATANSNAQTSTATNAAPAAAPTTPVDSSTNVAANETANNANSNASTTANTSGTQMATNTTGNAADLSSVPDTQKKYSRANRARDFKKEAQVTAQLNQKEASLNGASNGISQQ